MIQDSIWRAIGCFSVKKVLVVLVVLVAGIVASWGHPGSGIVVDDKGRVYFTDTGQGVWKIDEGGRVSAHEGQSYHWMTIDLRAQFAAGLPQFVEPSTSIERVGKNPTLILSSDFPVTMGKDGALVYPEFAEGGPLRVYRLEPAGGRKRVLATLENGADGGELKWLNGMATGVDGSVYFTENAAVRRITPEGEVKTLARNVAVADCQRIEGAAERLGPMLRGLDVGRDGSVYVAANACRALLKVSPSGAVSVVLRLEAPWSPTGVAVSGELVYVLEFLHTNGNDRREWIPRVRKISADGSSAIIAEIERVGEKESRPMIRPAP